MGAVQTGRRKMGKILHVEDAYHRSKARIRGLGEVFTPDSFVEEMLDLITEQNKNLWSDEDIVFFEPTCGHGNIVTAILRRRLNGFYKKAISHSIKDAPLYAVANAVNSLWAIDIDGKNVNECRERTINTCIAFLADKYSPDSLTSTFEKNCDFYAHLLCAIYWQISENEMLSAISSSGHETRTGSRWIKRNGVRAINFDLTWATHFETCEKQEATPIFFHRALKLTKARFPESIKTGSEFEFARAAMQSLFNPKLLQKPNNEATVGA